MGRRGWCQEREGARGPGGWELGAGGWEGELAAKGQAAGEKESLIWIFSSALASVTCLLSGLSVKSLIKLLASWRRDKHRVSATLEWSEVRDLPWKSGAYELDSFDFLICIFLFLVNILEAPCGMNWFYIVSHQPWLLSRMFIDELISGFRVLLVQIHPLRLHKVPIGLNMAIHVWGYTGSLLFFYGLYLVF